MTKMLDEDDIQMPDAPEPKIIPKDTTLEIKQF